MIKWNKGNIQRLLMCQTFEDFDREFPETNPETLTRAKRRFKEKIEEPQMTDEEMIARLEDKGYLLHKQAIVEDKEFVIDSSRFAGDVTKFAVVSDTHLGSRFQQLSHLKTAYSYFKEVGVKTVLHCGDMFAGNGRVYRGQTYELFVHGADEQLEYAREKYPQEDGITTYLISGNHCLSFLNSDGFDICKALSKEREDIIYLGQYGAYVDICGIRVYLHHGLGGVSYARTYKLQKLIEQLAPENKPQVFLAGHWHITSILPMYRNVFCLAAGCFETQTPFLRRLGVYPEVGFSIIEATKNPVDREDGITRFKYEWYPFYVPKINDF